MEIKRLRKSSTDKVLFGVCGGLAEYFGIDSLIVRLLFVLLSIAVGSGLILYIVCAILIPDELKAAQEEEARRAYFAQQNGPYAAERNTAYQNYSYSAQEVQPKVQPEAKPAAEKEPEPVSYQERAAYAGPEQEAPKREAPKAETFRTAAPGQETPKAERPAQETRHFNIPNPGQSHANTQQRSANAVRDSRTLGIILVAIGGLILLKYFIPRISSTLLFAVLLIAAGLYFLIRRK